MAEYTIKSDYASVIALDQHARTVTLVGCDLSTGEKKVGKLVRCPQAAEIAEWALEWASEPIRFVYESGPCGFQLARDLRSLGYACDVIAVSSIPRSTEDRLLKDDRRDAHRLLDAVLSPNSKCKYVHLLDEKTEAVRDLIRSYYDAVLATKRLKMQFSSMLLRHGIVWDKRTPSGNLCSTWTKPYLAWARSIELPEDAANKTLKFYLTSVVSWMEKCKELKRECLEIALSQTYKPYVDALTRLKGVNDMVALTYIATMDDFDRFKNGRSVTSYFGLIPKRNDSGEKTGRGGSVTKAGDTLVRHVIIEGLSGLPNFKGNEKVQRKGREVSAAIEAEAIRCNARIYARYHHFIKVGKRPNVAKVAVAGELVRQMWFIGRMVKRELEAASPRLT